MSEYSLTPFTPKRKYHIWYYAIINRARERAMEGYRERHHIIPRSLGGTNEADNLVDLLFKEHFICHWLLTRMTEGKSRRKMLAALNYMCNGNGGRGKKKNTTKRRGIIAAWRYVIARKAARDAQIGNKRPGIHTEKFKSNLSIRLKGNTYLKGKKFERSPEAIENIKSAWTDERREAVRDRAKKNNPMHSEMAVQKIKASWTDERRATAREKFSLSGIREKGTAKLKGRKRPDVTARCKGIKLPEEQVQKRKAAWTPERRAEMSARMAGKKLTPEWRAAISAGNKGKNTGKKLSPEHVAKICTPEFRAASRARAIERNRSPEFIAKVKAAKARTRAARIQDEIGGSIDV